MRLFLFFSLFAGVALAGDPCNPRFFTEGMVCVCDEFWCDSLDPLTTTGAGIVQIFESDRDGNKRFVRRLQQFNGTENPSGQVWNIVLQRDSLNQEMLGIGGSFSDAAALVIGRLSPKLQRDVYSSYFADTGIEFALGRITISGSDFSTRPYSYDDVVEDIGLDSFGLVDEDISYKIPQLKLAKELAAQPVKWFGSSWAPPAWMKTNNASNGAGTLRDGAGSEIWESYSKYLVKFLDAYKYAGVDLWGMTVQNEPMTGFAENYVI